MNPFVDAVFGKHTRHLCSIAGRDAHPEALESLVVTDHPIAGRLREPRSAARFVGTLNARPCPSAALGRHTEEILAELGISKHAEALRAEGVIQ